MLLLSKITFEKSVSFLMILYFIAIMSSNAVLQITSVLLLLAAISFLISKKNPDGVYTQVITKAPKILLISLIVFTISGILSLALNVHNIELFFDSVGEYRWVIQFFVLVILLNNFFKFSWIKISHSIYLVAVILSIYAIWQSFSGIDLISGKHYRLFNYGGMYRSIGTFSIPLTLAYVYGFLFFSIFPQLIVKGLSYSRRRKIILSLIALLLVVVIVLTQTRGAWLAFALTIFLTILMYKPTRKYCLVLLVISPLFYFVMPSQLQHRIKSIGNVKTDTSNTGRFKIWQAHYNVFKKNKLFGVGMGNNKRQLPEEYRLMGIEKGKVSHAHNNIIQILSAQGLFGAIPFVIFHIIFLLMAVKLVSHGPSPETVALGLMSSAIQVYLFIGGMTEATFIDQEINHPLVLTWALTMVVFYKNKFYKNQRAI